MLYVFEGTRNSGKTYLSNYISKKYSIPRFQFAFSEYFKRLSLESSGSREAHAFALGKELAIMQMSRDIKTSFIHDRGILTVLAWGLIENRITEEEVRSQVKMIKDLNLLDGLRIIFIKGDNPQKGERNKDQWDHFDGDDRELISYRKVLDMFEEQHLKLPIFFTNHFDFDSLIRISKIFDNPGSSKS